MCSKRLATVRKHALEIFRSFYTLRSLCITSIVASLSNNNFYGKFHKSYNVTNNFYLNQNDKDLL